MRRNTNWALWTFLKIKTSEYWLSVLQSNMNQSEQKTEDDEPNPER